MVSVCMLLEKVARRRTNQAEETKDTAEDFDDEDLDEEIRVRGVRERGRGARDANADTAQEVACADGEATPEEREA